MNVTPQQFLAELAALSSPPPRGNDAGSDADARLARVASRRAASDSIVDELTGHARNRVFAYAPYVELLSEGSEPL